MNCQDISLALDDRDTGALSAAERREFDAHLAACEDCANDYDLHLRMQATPTPLMPTKLPADVRALVAAHSGLGGGRRASSRFVLLGTALMVAAAAAMLAVRLVGTSTPRDLVEAPAPGSAVPVEPGGGTSPLPDMDQAAPDLADASIAPKEPLVEVKPFFVRLLPLKNEAKDAAGSRAVVAIHAAFLDRLRAVPGVTLLGPDDPDGQPTYRITISGGQIGSRFTGSLGVETLKQDGTPSSSSYFGMNEDLSGNCVSALQVTADYSNCGDPEGVAINLLGRLRKMSFPPDPALQRQVQARLFDRTLEEKQRLSALSDLALFGRMYPGEGGIRPAGASQALRDAAVVRGAISLGTNAVDPMHRAQVWNTLRGVGNPELIGPLIAAMGQDSTRDVRLAALSTLVADFGQEPRVRAALETATHREAHPMLRALATRAVGDASGNTAWRDYILTSLKDPNRSFAERVEALFYQMDLPTSTAFGTGMRASVPQSLTVLLDAESIPALTAALPAVAAESLLLQQSTARLVGELARIENPAITDMLLASLDGGSQWLDQYAVASALGAVASRRADPRVRAALEKMRDDDANPELRQAAVKALNGPNAAPPVSDKPRLGVQLRVFKAGDAAPENLLGKVMVFAMFPGGVAHKAGMSEGDVLLEINGSPVASPEDSIRIMDKLPRGVDIEVLVERAGEKMRLQARF